MLCIAGMLCVQMSGLHQHRHVDLHQPGNPHAVQLHFEDFGWHGDSRADEHRHAPAAVAEHPHLDIETRVFEDGLAKVLLIALLCLLTGLCFLLWPHRQAPVSRPAHALPPRKRSCYDGPPPSQAPPGPLSRTSWL
jgi:hypothetical protein